MFRFIKKVLILVLVSTANSLKCISLKNQECKVREVVVKNKYMPFPYDFKVNSCVESCNNISNPYSKVCIADVIKNVTVKMFDLIESTNATKQVEFHESCKCVCKTNSTAFNNKQKFNKNKCRCTCLINKKCDNDFIWNYSNCECEYRRKQPN